ncbi:putative ribonuclease H-like domain-containing protein [Tanacetum coccineum]
MTGNKSYLTDYQDIDGGFVAFAGSPKSFNLKNVVPSRGLTCLFSKATIDESNLWHRRFGHVNFKTMNKLVRENLVRDHLGKFAGMTDEGSLVGYSINRSGPEWLFDIDSLTKYMKYEPVTGGNQTNDDAGLKSSMMSFVMMLERRCEATVIGFKPSGEEEKIDSEHQENEDSEVPNTEEPRVNQEQDANVNNTNNINTVSPTVSAADIENNVVDENIVYGCIDDPNMPNLEEIVYSDDDEEVGAEADMNNLATNVPVSPIPTTRVHKDHPLEQIIGDIHSAPQTRRMTKNVTEHEAMQEELLQFKLPKVWTLVDLPHGKRAIGTKWVYRNKKDKRGIGVYVGDIIFGSTKKSLCVEFEQMMHKRFQMSFIGELTFFLGLQVKQKDDGIFISQDKYVAHILKKFDFAIVKTTSTPIKTNKAFLKDEEVNDVDVYLYRSMIRSLMYLIASRPVIMFAVCAYTRFQVTPKVLHLHAVKRIFRYLKGQPKLSLWYPRDSPFDLESFSDSDYAGASLDKKSTTGGCQFLGKRLISWQYKTVYKDWKDRMEMAATTASSLEAEQDNGNINRTQSMATLNEYLL